MKKGLLCVSIWKLHEYTSLLLGLNEFHESMQYSRSEIEEPLRSILYINTNPALQVVLLASGSV
jgi:hypothetical protein